MSKHSEERTRRLKKSILTSFVGKFSSIALQVVSMPIAAAALGNQGFAAYSVIASMLSWLALSNVGIGPALALRLSAALGKDDREAAADVFNSGRQLTLLISTIVAFAVIALILSVDVEGFFFGNIYDGQKSLRFSMLFVVFVFYCMANLSVIESAQIAFQESYRLNSFVSCGLLCSAVCVYLAAIGSPDIFLILVAVNLPNIIFRFINAFIFTRKLKFPRCPVRFHSAVPTKGLLSDGVRFSASGALNNFLSNFFSIIVLAKVCAASYVASFSAVINAIVLLASFFSISAVPLSGAVPEAKARNDVVWIKKMYIRVLFVNLIYASTVAILMAFFGADFFEFWYQGSISPDKDLFFASGVYFILLAVEVTNFSFLSATGLISRATIFLAGKAVIYAFALVLLVDQTVVAFPIWLGVSANFIFSMIPLTLISLKTIVSIQK